MKNSGTHSLEQHHDIRYSAHVSAAFFFLIFFYFSKNCGIPGSTIVTPVIWTYSHLGKISQKTHTRTRNKLPKTRHIIVRRCLQHVSSVAVQVGGGARRAHFFHVHVLAWFLRTSLCVRILFTFVLLMFVCVCARVCARVCVGLCRP